MTTRALDGILVVDKPRGPTSHDIVAWARRALGERHIGHCGTLDPMATGVLVIAVGEATKLAQVLGADAKSYEATIRLGVATSSGDEDGDVIETRAVPPIDEAGVRALCASMIGPRKQRPPVVSAIKVGGVPLYERVRRGETVEAPERDVVVHALELVALDTEAHTVSVEVTASKGFYVRSLAIEIAEALGAVGHLVALRRVRAGRIDLARAVDGDVLMRASRGDVRAKEAVADAVLPWSRAREVVEHLEVTADDELRLRQGKRVEGIAWTAADDALVCAVAEKTGVPVALVRRDGGALVVARGFVSRA